MKIKMNRNVTLEAAGLRAKTKYHSDRQYTVADELGEEWLTNGYARQPHELRPKEESVLEEAMRLKRQQREDARGARPKQGSPLAEAMRLKRQQREDAAKKAHPRQGPDLALAVELKRQQRETAKKKEEQQETDLKSSATTKSSNRKKSKIGESNVA